MIRVFSPASGFAGSLLIGSGRMGASVPGQPVCERITLTHQDFWSGALPDTPRDAGCPGALRRARALALQGDIPGMEQALHPVPGDKGQYGTSLPAADLVLEFSQDGPCTEYVRTLDTEQGEITIFFLRGTSRHMRRIHFAGHRLVMEITDASGTDVSLRLESPYLRQFAFNTHGAEFVCQALETRHSDGQHGSSVHGLLNFESDTVPVVQNSRAVFSGFHSLRIFLDMGSDLLSQLGGQGLPEIHASVGRPEPCSLPELRIPGEEKLAQLFDLGIYLARASASPDSLLPATLQGVWNDGVASRIGWTCDMHLDINTQMNEWVRGPAGLGLSPGLLRWVRRLFLEDGQRQAGETYGLDGTVAEMTSNAWGFARPYWHPSLSPCPACGWWLMLTITDLWYYQRDPVLLRQEILPLLALHVRFVLGYYENGCGFPSVSPENAYCLGGSKHYASVNPAFELTMARGILETYLDLSLRAGEETLRAPVRALLESLPEIPVLPDGTIAEFGLDAPALDPQHRHLSHLLGLFPLFQISPDSSPELARAAEKTLYRRTHPAETWEDTGWSRSMLALYEARLYHGNACLEHLRHMQEHLCTASGLIMHPPTRGAQAPQDVWEMDGNTGFSMAVMEMLVQSGPDWIRLLPALPDSWPDGEIRHVRTRCGADVSLAWRTGRVTNFRIGHICSPEAEIYVQDRHIHFTASEGSTIVFEEGRITCM